MEGMNTRPLGRTGLMVSEIGFGAWGLSGVQWIGAREDESLRALHRALDRGVNLIDTALAYGDGASERIVGRALRERGDAGASVVVATKVPPRNRIWPATGTAAEVYPAEHVRASCEESLRHLGRDHVDLLQLHVWHDRFLREEGWKDALLGLKRAGKARFVGISVGEHDADSALGAASAGLFDTLQILYNIFDQRPAEALLPACAAHGLGVLARVPFDEGGLTGEIRPDTTFPEGDFRNGYFQGDRRRQVFERAEALKGLLGQEAATLPELALRFCLSNDAVSTVIPGMRSAARVDANVPAGDGRRLSPALLEALRAHAWPRNFYQ
jgi:aryl-alcohol dehydrogenase-like predicted oxidoreductase